MKFNKLEKKVRLLYGRLSESCDNEALRIISSLLNLKTKACSVYLRIFKENFNYHPELDQEGLIAQIIYNDLRYSKDKEAIMSIAKKLRISPNTCAAFITAYKQGFPNWARYLDYRRQCCFEESISFMPPKSFESIPDTRINEADFDRGEQFKAIEKIIRRLPKKQEQIISGRLKGIPFCDMANTPQAAHYTYKRAIKILREILNKKIG